MITEEQYLEAKKIVDAYKLQLKQARVIGSKPKPKSKKKVIDIETWTRWNEIIKNISAYYLQLTYNRTLTI